MSKQIHFSCKIFVAFGSAIILNLGKVIYQTKRGYPVAQKEEKFMTLNPDKNKSGVNIDKEKYDIIKQAIRQVFKERKDVSYSTLTNLIKARLADSFTGSIRWYVEVVKLDMEARKMIVRIPNTKPQMYKLSGK
jgi:hypothetical protein